MTHHRLYAFVGVILLGVVSRLIPHPPNATAINALALFSGWSLGSLPLSMASVIVAMMAGDLIFGLHSTLLSVYASIALICLLGYWQDPRKITGRLSVLAPASSFLFFLITNFGMWASSGLYPSTFEGLVLCYIAAIPFLVNQLCGDIIYTTVIFGCYDLGLTKLKRDGYTWCNETRHPVQSYRI